MGSISKLMQVDLGSCTHKAQARYVLRMHNYIMKLLFSMLFAFQGGSPACAWCEHVGHCCAQRWRHTTMHSVFTSLQKFAKIYWHWCSISFRYHKVCNKSATCRHINNMVLECMCQRTENGKHINGCRRENLKPPIRCRILGHMLWPWMTSVLLIHHGLPC